MECPGLEQLGDRSAVLVDAVVPQLLVFSDACRKVCTQARLSRQRDQPSRPTIPVVRNVTSALVCRLRGSAEKI
jgi:hypothetical protein